MVKSKELRLFHTAEELDGVIDKTLFAERNVFFFDDVNEESIGKLIKRLRYLDNLSGERIRVYIQSYGGEVYPCLGLYEFIRGLRSKVDIEVLGYVMSASVFVLACCATGKRVAHEYSRFMCHQMWGGFEGKSSDIQADAREYRELDKIFGVLFEKHTKLSRKQLRNLESVNSWFGSDKALEFGFVDVIV